MNEYHKIKTVYLRDPETKFQTLLEGEYALPEFDYLRHDTWIFTEKVDGTNIRISVTETGELDIRGKTEKAQIPPFLHEQIVEILNPGKLRDTGLCLYGEGYGARIQKGGGNYISDGVSYVLFDVFCGGLCLQREDVQEIGETLGLRVVPIIGAGS